jgi:hypothetical protein
VSLNPYLCRFVAFMASLVVLKRKDDKNADQVKTKNHCDANPLLLKGILNFVIPAKRQSGPSNAGRPSEQFKTDRANSRLEASGELRAVRFPPQQSVYEN